jgi:hypothetical protein
VAMSDPVSCVNFYTPQNHLTKSFDSNSLRKTICDSFAANKNVSIVRTEINISRGHNPSSYEVPLPCYNFGSVASWYEPRVASLAVTFPSRSS